MRTRQVENPLADDLQNLLKQGLDELAETHTFSGIIMLPSVTWINRLNIGEFISKELHVPLFTDFLYWRKRHEVRHGELLNNDQRRHNVSKNMTCPSKKSAPKGILLLVDDYIGSGATMREAIRDLRKEAMMNNIIVPFTIAAIRWRLGKRGMIS